MKRAHWNLNKKTYITAGAISVAGCFLMVAFPEISMNGCQAGFNLFVGTVLPTLFPFFVAVNFMIRLGIPERIGRLFEPVFRRVYGCGGIGAFICILSIFSGYPMAAKLVGDYCRNRRITPLEGKRILSFSCVSGPLFIVGTVGTAMLGSAACGYLIALGHYSAALINGLLFCRFVLPREESRPAACGVSAFQAAKTAKRAGFPAGRNESFAEAISDAIYGAFRSLVQICGYIVLFSIASEFLQFSGLLGSLPGAWSGAAAKGILEMTMGCDAAAALPDVSGAFQLALCAFLLSFGGLSIAGQSLSMLSESRIEGSYYLFMKFCHGCLAAALTMGLALLAQRLGYLDVTASAVYGSDHQAVQVLGGIHSLIFSARSIAAVAGLSAVLVLADRMAFQVRRRFLHQREKRRKESL